MPSKIKSFNAKVASKSWIQYQQPSPKFLENLRYNSEIYLIYSVHDHNNPVTNKMSFFISSIVLNIIIFCPKITDHIRILRENYNLWYWSDQGWIFYPQCCSLLNQFWAFCIRWLRLESILSWCNHDDAEPYQNSQESSVSKIAHL